MVQIARITGHVQTLEQVLHGAVVLFPLLKEGLEGIRLGVYRRRRALSGFAFSGHCFGRFWLALAALVGGLGSRQGGRSCGTRHRDGTAYWPRVVVNTLHVVAQVPLTWEAVAGLGSIAVFIGTEEGLVAVAM